MSKLQDSISRKLTVLNVLVGGAAVLLACAAFFAYDVNNFRQTMINDLSIQAQIIGSNAVSPLVFDDQQSAEKTLSALQASSDIIYAGIYMPSGQFFAGYWRDRQSPHPEPPPPPHAIEHRWLGAKQIAILQPIIFDGKKVGSVYIISDRQGLVDRIENYLLILATIFVISLIAALLLGRMAQRVISRPISQLAETARIVSRDKNYAVRATPTASHDEISVLIGSFNAMLAEIQQRDISLQDSERQFRTLADSLPQLAWMAEADGSVFWYNQRWYEYTGTTPEQMLGWGWEAVHDPKVLPEVLERWRTAIRTEQRFEMVFPLRAHNGTYRDFLTLTVPVRDAHGAIVRWFGTNTDITDQRRAEEALRKSEKLAATGRLAASIAHEINNPLEAVTNLLYLARRQPANADNYLTIADQELDRIAEITKHTLGFYRDTSIPVPVNISDVVGGVLTLYARKLEFKKITVKKRFAEHAEILGFPGELRQIFANLVANAIEAMNENGCLTVKLSPARDWRNSQRCGIRASLLDTGPGIDAAQMGKIFEPFYTTKKDAGTGLGLWLTQNLVRKHHGQIYVRSRIAPGRSGTLFSVFLPDSGAGEEELSLENKRNEEVPFQ